MREGRGWERYKGKGYEQSEGWKDCADKLATIYRQYIAPCVAREQRSSEQIFARGRSLYSYIIILVC